jgi:hypothetical protein
MTPDDRTPGTAPIPPELAPLDFDPCAAPHTYAERLAGDVLVSLARLEVEIRSDIARAARLAAEAEAEHLAAETEDERRRWRERALLAEGSVRSASLGLAGVLDRRSRALRSLVLAAGELVDAVTAPR